MAAFNVTMKVTKTYTFQVDAADIIEAEEVAFDLPLDELETGDTAIDDMTVDREVLEVSPAHDDPATVGTLEEGEELYGLRPMDDDDPDGWDEDDRFNGNM